MTTIEVVEELRARGVRLRTRDGRIGFSPADRVDDALRTEMFVHKQALLDWLAERDGVTDWLRTRTETIVCAGDQCNELITLIGGQGWCPNHKMTIRVVDWLT